MHPILFRVPLPHGPLKVWWALAAVALIAFVYLVLALRQKDRSATIGSGLTVVGAAAAGWVWRGATYEAPDLPIYAYGVMLGLSLVIRWDLPPPPAPPPRPPDRTKAKCFLR